jgi:hypothetical protein
MYWLPLILNLFVLGALFSNNRLASLLCFLSFTSINLYFLFQASPTDLDSVFFVIMTLSSLVVYTWLTVYSRDQVLTHQKKRASYHLIIWSILIAVFFGHWMLSLSSKEPARDNVHSGLIIENAEIFILLSVIVLWMVGKELYDRR